MNVAVIGKGEEVMVAVLVRNGVKVGVNVEVVDSIFCGFSKAGVTVDIVEGDTFKEVGVIEPELVLQEENKTSKTTKTINRYLKLKEWFMKERLS